MKTCDNSELSVLRNVEWTSVADASAPILRKAAAAAVLHDSRLELRYDVTRGEYDLGVAAGR